MKCQKCIILFFLLWLALITAAQQTYNFRPLNLSNGLPSNQIRGLFLCPDGRLGIRTISQINLYDGSRFTNYSYSDRLAYPWYKGNMPPMDYLDNEGRLWAKDWDALQVLDLYKEVHLNVDSLLFSFGIKERLANLFVDNDGLLWFVGMSGDVFFRGCDEKLRFVCSDSDFILHNGHPIGIGSSNAVCWMMHENGIIRCWDIETGKFTKTDSTFLRRVHSQDRVVFRSLPDGNMWLMWNRGVSFYNANQQSWTDVEDIQVGALDLLTAITVDSDNNAWVGSSISGVYVVNSVNLSVKHLPSIPLFGGGEIQNDISNILISPQNGLVCIGFKEQGIAVYHPSMCKFSLFNLGNTHNRLGNESVKCLIETEDRQMLVGTNEGLYRLNPVTHEIDIPYSQLRNTLCRRLSCDSQGRIWLGTFHEGLYCIDKGEIRHYFYPEMNYQTTPNYNNIRSNLLEDKKGRIWVTVSGGLARFNPEDGTFDMVNRRHKKLARYIVSNALVLTENGTLIVGSDNGLYFYNPDNDSVWIPEQDAPDDSRFIHASRHYNDIYCDSRGFIWFGTDNGLYILDDNHLYSINSNDELPNNMIQGIIEDNNHDVWISTSNGLCRIVVKREEELVAFNVLAFNVSDGLQKGEFHPGSKAQTAGGTIYLGGVNGFNSFTPADIIYNNSENKPVFTALRLFNAPIKAGQVYNKRVLLSQGISYTQNIELNYNENFITLEFAGLNFVNPAQSYYRFRLEGFDKAWTEIRSDNGRGQVTYTGLAPGKYTFEVYTGNNDKLWGKQPAKITFLIHPPFWNTLGARIFYALLLIAAITGLVLYMNQRNKKKLANVKLVEAERQKHKLEQMKLRFFTNISHEFRTPLTLILTPLDTLIRRTADEGVKNQLSSIYRNAQELLELVNQLLDFRKLEMKGESLNLTHGDMYEFTYNVFCAFRSIAAKKNIRFELHSEEKALYMYFDKDKLLKMLNNLLSNAFKFTPEGGEITLLLYKEHHREESFVKIQIKDNGCGILPEDIERIFERFYQIKNVLPQQQGSGIGLHLVKEYAQLHQGNIEVENNSGGGSIFTLSLPMNLKTEEEPIEIEEEELSDSELTVPNKKPTLLIVEDNSEFRQYLINELAKWYHLFDAPDGEEGERIAIAKSPDLIVSDIMMPKVDGIELCQRIKTNIGTSHIPVILLTARSSDEAKISGYEAGADSYISKPFSLEILLIRIRKLIEQREKRHESFRRTIEVNPSKITITSLDELLVQKALECVEANMSNTDYSVAELSADLNMTRMNLYRKFQSITGQTPKEFIRSIRMKRAAQLLQESQLTIAEISDKVGINTPRYFTKLFKEAFEVTPSQYVEEYRKGKSES